MKVKKASVASGSIMSSISYTGIILANGAGRNDLLITMAQQPQQRKNISSGSGSGRSNKQ